LKTDDTPWWGWVLLINSVLIAATIVWPHVRTAFPGLAILHVPLGELNLSFEMNLAVWWAGICLLVTGLLCYELYSTGAGLYWLPIAPVFLGLSFDEIGSIHERASWHLTRTQVLALLLAGGLCLVPAIAKLLRAKSTRTSALLLLFGFLLMASAVVHEHIEIQIGVPDWLVGLRAGMEEGSELMGTFLCLLAVVRERGPDTLKGGLLAVIPNPFRMHWIRPLLVAATLGQVVIAFLTVATVDISYRGNPAIYIPSAMFFLLFLASLWHQSFEGSAREGLRRLLAILLLLASVATFHLLSPGAIQWLGNTTQLYILWILYLLVAGALAVATRDRNGLAPVAPLIVVAISFAAAALIGRQLAHYIAAGIAALAMALAVMAPLRRPPA
jgi:hypothetical protein